jgi:hypothetical protein
MSERKPGVGSGAGDLGDAPFIDGSERAESAWLIARERDPGTPAPSSKIASGYTELDDLLGNLPLGPYDDSWHEDVLRLATAAAATATSAPVTPSRPSRRPVYRWMAGGALIAAAAVAVLMLRPHPRMDELEIAIHHGDPRRGDSKEAVVGDHLIIRAQPREASELRVYRADGSLVARCPAGPGCTPAYGTYAIDVTLAAPVQHYVILVIGLSSSLPEGTMDAYLDAARAVNARVVTYQPIDVR